MAANNSSGQGAASSPAPRRPEDIRNVVLVGPSGSGKSTLFEHLMAARVPGYRAKETAKGGDTRSVGLEVATIDVAGLAVTVVDTPGYADFAGELRAGLRAADAALFVVSAADGVDAATAMLWHECETVGVPRALVVTKLESGRGGFADTVAQCRRVFGDAQPLYLPVQGDDGRITGTLALLSRRHYDSSGDTLQVRDASPEQLEEIEAARGDLVEAIITESEDDTLLDRYLEGEDISVDTIRDDLMTAVGAATFFPAIPISAFTGAGVPELLEIITEAFPDPTARRPLPMVTTLDGEPVEPLAGDPDGQLVAEVVKTSTDPYVGRVSLVRVFNGTLRTDDVVHVSGHLSSFAGKAVEGHPDHDSDERVGPLSVPTVGGEHTPAKVAIAGQLVEVAKLAHAETGDTLSAKDAPVVVEPWLLPEPLLPVAIHPASKADEDKLASALQRLVAEDVTMRLDHNAETHQTVLWTMGQAHVDLLLARLQDRYQVTVEAEPLRVALRETFVAPAAVVGRHVKQSGGHGQFAVCHLRIEPLERGAGFEFVDKVVGGAVPRQFIPSVEKGVRAQMAKGTLAGYPMVDIRVTLVDGKAHSVDSSDMAFQTAGALALKEATSSATVTLLEPVDSVDVTVADDFVGAAMSDLSTRRGRVSGTEPAEEGRTVIHAEVPALELTRYAIDLRSVSHGTGSFTRELLRYDPLPQHLAAQVITG
ncbi:elongation factor G-like protein EF-G2 [Arsenicicoccus sp. oral taxon 190]|uniref:elongation factor G-like protein EF-G2 n=1 Tax=Arsenicicoccus sp. oral taxon 190 TaxID=1658671 RepID=UPI00067A2FEA|nr:elongation factor G-like protein EF-G2 [Arsenicicoccus sp. oral taxon 190]AKT51798.1 elongation factor G [Arsenicicoccus sp. oral taxon 190]